MRLLSPGAAPADEAADRLLSEAVLLEGLGSTHAGLCLCDERDEVRWVNDAFREAFFPNAAEAPGDFTDALAAAIAAGFGIRLQTMPLAEFVPRVKAQRRGRGRKHDFSLDTVDGRWWRIVDHKLANGWILAVATDISLLKEEELALRTAHACAVQASLTDALTGLPNRRAGMERAAAMLRDFESNRLPFAVALIDIDNFKRINDNFGHATGDDVIGDFAAFLARATGGDARRHVSRIGGEEFLLLLAETPVERAERLLGRLLADLPPLLRGDGGGPLAYTFSGGLAAARRGERFETLLARADAALYSAKANGRARVEVADRGN